MISVLNYNPFVPRLAWRRSTSARIPILRRLLRFNRITFPSQLVPPRPTPITTTATIGTAVARISRSRIGSRRTAFSSVRPRDIWWVFNYFTKIIFVKRLSSFFRPQSDSNLNNYQYGSGTGDTSPMESSVYSSNGNNGPSSPFKNDYNKSSANPDYEPYNSQSSFNLNFGVSAQQPQQPSPVQKMDKGTMYSSDLLVSWLS